MCADTARTPCLVLALAAAGSVFLASAVPSAQEPAEVSLSVVEPAGPLQPGGVGLVVVSASMELSALAGEAFGRPVRFWRGASPTEWRGLVGVDLGVAPGSHALSLIGPGTNGGMAEARHVLRVEPKRFETRRLRVAPDLVKPPPEQAARIEREAKAMADSFAVVSPERLWRGRFDAPVPGVATSSYGRLTLMNGEAAGRHQGADFRASTGTTVRAPNAGSVVLAQELYFAGNTVILDHGLGVFSLVAHLSRIDVAVGGRVSRGDQLGASGATGRVTGPHLHWAVRFNDASVDPQSLMQAVAGLADEGDARTTQ